MTADDDREVFERMYEEHTVSVWRFALRLGRDRAEAEDLFQETWLRAARTIATARAHPNPRSWLLTIAANLQRDNLRKLRIRRRFLSLSSRPAGSVGAAVDPPGRPDSDAAAAAERSELQDAIARALDRLPRRQRAVFVLKHMEGHSYADVGRILALPEGTAKSLMYRAVRRLRRDLGDWAPGAGTVTGVIA